MTRYNLYTPDETFSRQVNKSQVYLDKVLKAVKNLKLRPRDQDKLCALLGTEGCTYDLRLSDVLARIKATGFLVEEVQKHFQVHVSADMKVYHITFADGIGITSDRTPVIRMKALKRKIYKAMQSMGLSGIVMLEIQPLLNYPAGGDGRTLMLNGHALCWGRSSTNKLRDAKKKLNLSRSWSNQFGAKPIVSRRLRLGVDDALRIACYLSKMPHDAKYLSPNAKGELRFKPTLQNYPNILALRIAEGLSHYTIYDAVFGVGDGCRVRSKWKCKLARWHKHRASVSDLTRVNIPSLWRRAYRKYSNNLYQPFDLNRATDPPRPMIVTSQRQSPAPS